jgi:hypothetical protein
MNWSAILNGVWWPDRNNTGLPCNAVALPGGEGIADNTIALNPSGGVITIMFNAQGVPDKLEIIHGNSSGTKVATSGMTTANAGPFDNVFGTEPTNTVPTVNQTLTVDQFIGTNKGTIPTRAGAYTIETGNASPLVAPYQQLVWWVYTTADYQVSPFVTIRVTGPSGTAWAFQRACI